LASVGAGGLMNNNIYKGSPALLIPAVYPEYEWLPWKFSKTTKTFWADNKSVRRFLDWAGKQLGIKELEDWNKMKITVNLQ
jgi:hypothetical protein